MDLEALSHFEVLAHLELQVDLPWFRVHVVVLNDPGRPTASVSRILFPWLSSKAVPLSEPSYSGLHIRLCSLFVIHLTLAVFVVWRSSDSSLPGAWHIAYRSRGVLPSPVHHKAVGFG